MVDLVAVRAAVETVDEPELHRSLGELNMVKDVRVGRNGVVDVLVALTIPEYPLQGQLIADVSSAANSVEGVVSTRVQLTTMSDQERSEVMNTVKGGAGREVRVGAAGSTSRIVAMRRVRAGSANRPLRPTWE